MTLLKSKNIGLTKRRNMKIGLLGGSFNPAHEGHIYISETAIKLLGLDEIWWLVTPQNPLKKSSKPLEERVKFAKNLVKNNKIRIEAIEKKYQSNYTLHTLQNIIKQYSGTKFIWLMGADNLAEINKWYKWKSIFNIMPIAVFDRGYYSYTVFNSIAGKHYFSNLHKTKNSKSIFNTSPPIWTFLHINKNPLSSSKLRNKKNFLKILNRK